MPVAQAIYASVPDLASPLNNYAILAALATAEAPHQLLRPMHVEVAERPVFFLAISNNFPIILTVLYPGRHGAIAEVKHLIYATARYMRGLRGKSAR